MKHLWRRYSAGTRAAAPFALAVFLFGVSFGVLAEAAGIGPLASVVMSATTFAGSAQFAIASILSAGGGIAAAIGAAVLLNARYLAIALSVAPVLHGGPLRRALKAQLVTDESWALSTRESGGYSPRILIGAGVLLWCSWVAGTTVGVVAGDVLGEPETLGLDAAFPALFLGLLLSQLRTRLAIRAALAGAAIALALVPLTPAGLPIILSAVVCVLGWNRPGANRTEQP